MTTEPDELDRTTVGRPEARGAMVVCAVADDGPGGADSSRGTGLRGLEDRVAAIGGALDLISPKGHGTTLVARIPVTQGHRRDGGPAARGEEPTGP